MAEDKISGFIKRMRESSLIGGDRRKKRIDEELEKAEGKQKEEKVEDVNKHKWKGVL